MSRLFSIFFLTFFASVASFSHAQEAASEASEQAAAATEQTAANTFVLMQTSSGDIIIELFDSQAPETVKNFLSYVDDGFYEGTIFHRVIPNFMIQGGGFTKELSKKDTKKPVKNEAKEELMNLRGTIAMARTSAPDSATSQFFINSKDNPQLDWRSWNKGYTVFGKVNQASLRVVDNISFSPTGTVGIYRDVPNQAVEIIKISRIDAATAQQQQQEAGSQNYFEENYGSSQGGYGYESDSTTDATNNDEPMYQTEDASAE